MRLRFSIRDLLWLTLLSAVLVAWWLEHRKWSNSDQPVVKVYPIKIANPSLVLPVLQNMLNGETGVRIGLDDTSNSVIVLARPAQQMRILELMQKMEQPPSFNPNSIPVDRRRRSGSL